MANMYAIETTGRAILSLLKDAYAKAGFEKEAKFVLYKATQFQEACDFQDSLGISLFFYRIGFEQPLKSPEFKRNSLGQIIMPGPLLNVNFILTAWAPTAEDQLWLLTWAMKTLWDNTLLSSEFLNANSPRPNTFGKDEVVEILYVPLTLADLSLVWEGLDQACIIPSVAFRVMDLTID